MLVLTPPVVSGLVLIAAAVDGVEGSTAVLGGSQSRAVRPYLLAQKDQKTAAETSKDPADEPVSDALDARTQRRRLTDRRTGGLTG